MREATAVIISVAILGLSVGAMIFGIQTLLCDSSPRPSWRNMPELDDGQHGREDIGVTYSVTSSD